MSNIQLISQVPGLTPEEQVALKAADEKRIISIQEFEMKGSVKKMITDALFNNGQNALGDSDLALMTGKIIHELKRNYSKLTISEVSQAMELGSKGKLGDFTHLSVRQIIKWLDEYIIKIRREANHKLKDFQEKKEVEVNLEKEAKRIKEFEERIVQTYEDFSIGDDIGHVGLASVIYQALEKRGKVDLDPEYLEAITDREASDYYEKIEKQELSFSEKAQLRQKGAALARYHEIEIKTRVQAEALLALFTKWKNQNYKLEL